METAAIQCHCCGLFVLVVLAAVLTRAMLGGPMTEDAMPTRKPRPLTSADVGLDEKLRYWFRCPACEKVWLLTPGQFYRRGATECPSCHHQVQQTLYCLYSGSAEEK